ncbi:hypothetical protein HDU67_008112 [Dinochytrium kinnereticum]|nr:hypothetical protein HDU67_008112 [Dinochytrium kinnereticum]
MKKIKKEKNDGGNVKVKKENVEKSRLVKPREEEIIVKKSKSSDHGLLFRSVVAEFRVYLPPFFANDPGQGVFEYLSKFLLRYVQEVGGVIIAFNNVKFLQNSAKVMYDCPYAHIPISTELTVFSPKINSLVVGVVNKVSPDHIGLLVHGVFNASIAADQIRKYEFAWRDKLSGWKRLGTDGPEAVIQPGSMLRFTVTGLTKANDILTLSGTLLKHPSTTGFIVQDGSFPAPPTSWAAPILEGETALEEEIDEEVVPVIKEEEEAEADLDDIVLEPEEKKKSSKGKRKSLVLDEDIETEVKEEKPTKRIKKEIKGEEETKEVDGPAVKKKKRK